MSVNTKMTAIADAIRAKTGGTAALSLDAMAEAIAGLEVGGVELPNFITEIKFGTFSYASATRSVSVEHGLSGKPTGFVVYQGSLSSNPGSNYVNAVYGHSGKIYNPSSGGTFSGTLVMLVGLTAYSGSSYPATDESFNIYTSSYNYYVQPNRTYYWIAWR